jgi:hypothetical protein
VKNIEDLISAIKGNWMRRRNVTSNELWESRKHSILIKRINKYKDLSSG